MRPTRPERAVLVGLPIALAAAGALLIGAGLWAQRAAAGDPQPLVAGSVCEAHELKARKERDPGLAIEIPKQYDTPWPTPEACRAHAAAEDPDTPGPLQPIPFSHRHHAGLFQIECEYCHAGTARSQAAGVPSVELCMGCHSQFPPSYDELEGIQNLKQHWQEQRPIEWVQIHRLPEYVQFRHNRHIQAGFACETCHGAVAEMDKVRLVPDTHWWPWMLPAQKLEMGWCIDCHRRNNASQDCYVCHY